MRNLLMVIPILLLCGTSRAADSPLQPIGWLVGGTWLAEIKPAKGDPTRVRMNVEWSAHKQAIKYAIILITREGEVTQYEGTYYWHPGSKEIRFLQVDRGGQITEGVTTIADGKLIGKNTLTRLDGTKQDQRTELTREGDDVFHFRALVPKGDEWVEGLNITYRRLRDLPARR